MATRKKHEQAVQADWHYDLVHSARHILGGIKSRGVSLGSEGRAVGTGGLGRGATKGLGENLEQKKGTQLAIHAFKTEHPLVRYRAH